jgi:hypothetical protein
MEALLAGAAIWLSLGAIKGIIWWQQIPQFMSWFVFYNTGQDQEAAATWHTKGRWLAFAVGLGLSTFPMFCIFAPLSLLTERMRYFGPYGSAYIAGLAAKYNKIDRGVEPLRFEEWEEYQTRLGDNPEAAMHGLTKIPFEKLPEKIQDVIKVASSLRDLQDRNVPEVDEEDEFRKDDDERK